MTTRLSAPVPNPATGLVRLGLHVDRGQAVRVAVVDALGREVAVVHDGFAAGGAALRLEVPTRGLSAGTYRVVARTAAGVFTRTLTVTR